VGSSAPEDFSEVFKLLARVAGEASRYAREKSGDIEMSRIISRNPAGDITRRVDREVEDYIYDMLRGSGINAVIVTEESGLLSVGKGNPEYLLLLDPIDGSINYVANIPYCSVSLAALPYKKNASVEDIVVGVISEIFRDRYYGFIRGYGAYVDGSPASTHIVDFKDAILAYFEEPDLVGRIHGIWSKLGKPKIRSLGAASLDIIYTSMGRFRAFIDMRGRLRNVDVAAAVGFAREVRAHVIDDRGAPIEMQLDRLATIGTIVVTRDREVVDLLRSTPALGERGGGS